MNRTTTGELGCALIGPGNFGRGLARALQEDARVRFAGVLGACLNAGVPARKAVVLAAEAAAPHPAFEGAPERLVEELHHGASLAEACVRAARLAFEQSGG